jgi:hypothetical protein
MHSEQDSVSAQEPTFHRQKGPPRRTASRVVVFLCPDKGRAKKESLVSAYLALPFLYAREREACRKSEPFFDVTAASSREGTNHLLRSRRLRAKFVVVSNLVDIVCKMHFRLNRPSVLAGAALKLVLALSKELESCGRGRFGCL